MSVFGNPSFQIESDVTDRIGIRTLAVSKMWQPKQWSVGQVDPQLDANFPSPPTTSGGIMLIGQQTRRDGGGCRTSWTYEGINGDGKSVTFKGRNNSLDYQFDPGFSQVSIQLHPNFDTLRATYQGYLNGDSVQWDEVLSSGGGTTSGMQVGASDGQKNPMFGVQDYLRLEGTYSFRYASLALPTSAGVGRILDSASLPGTAPVIQGADGARNWLMAPSPWKRRGTIYDITEIYWLSGEGGWPTPIYNPNAGSSSGGTGNFSINAASSFGFSESASGFTDN